MVEYAIKIVAETKATVMYGTPIDSNFRKRIICAYAMLPKKRIKPGLRRRPKRWNAALDKAAKISRQYINVPVTTDFAIMFLPTEGLYAEILRRPGLAEKFKPSIA